MKKLISLAMVALLALGANVSAQEGTNSGASGSTVGGIATTNVVIGAIALGVAAAVISNQDDDDDPVFCRDDQIEVGGVCQCPPGQIEVNGQCQDDPGELVCDQGGVLEGTICVITEFVTQTITITVDGSATTTLTQVPVTSTYPATRQ